MIDRSIKLKQSKYEIRYKVNRYLYKNSNAVDLNTVRSHCSKS